jgi:genome maintenance exonuclease 1
MKNQKQFTHKEKEWNLEEMSATTTTGIRLYNSPIGHLPSVTSVTGWKKKAFFTEWRKSNPVESKRVCNRGNLLHETIERYLLNENIDLESMPTLEAKMFVNALSELNKIDNVYELETPLWSELLGLAGRVDCVAEFDGKLSIIDFKGSTKKKSKRYINDYFLQATAYALMFQERTGVEINNIVIIITCEGGPVQVFEEEPKRYIKMLKHTIEEYRNENETTQHLPI